MTYPLPASHPLDRLLGDSPAITALRSYIRYLAIFDTVGNPYVPTVLLQGETGTGKGLVAHLIHASGPRAAGPFINVNCAAIPEHLLEAELFGFEAGAFTDAKHSKPGLLEAASGGTVFLDEIDTLPLSLQSKLLKAIEEKQVRRLGAVRERTVDVKIIAATIADLTARTGEGNFRADLYHRLALIVLKLPPLRERPEDIFCLAEQFLHRYAVAHGLSPKRLSDASKTWLCRYSWPGNVRELSHLIERLTLLSQEAIITPSTLEQLCLALPLSLGQVEASPEADDPGLLDERAQIQAVLRQTRGNVVQAARQLGLSRGAFRHRMRRYGMQSPRGQKPPSAATGKQPREPAPEQGRMDSQLRLPCMAYLPGSISRWQSWPLTWRSQRL